MKRKIRILELSTLIAVIALVMWLQRSPEAPASESPVAVSTQASPPVAKSGRLNIEGYYLGDEYPQPIPTGSPRLEFDSENKIFAIHGNQLSRDGNVLFKVGASHDEVKRILGPGNAFAHGGRAWGYWGVKEGRDTNPGLLIKFNHQGVSEVSLSQDWVPLSTEIALMGINGSSEPVDGSDGYKDFRDWAERSRSK